MFKKILIANRGEIACRVIKTAKKMGIRRWPSIPTPTATRATSSWPTRRCTSAPRPAARATCRPTSIIAACKQTGAAGGAPGLRLPVGERGLRPARRGRGHHLHRAEALFDRGDGRQDRLEEARERGQGQHHSRAGTTPSRPPSSAVEIAKDIGYPVMIKAIGRRRRQGPARGLQRQGSLRRLHLLPQRGAQQLRRRPRLHREVRRGAAPHRDPGARRLRTAT